MTLREAGSAWSFLLDLTAYDVCITKSLGVWFRWSESWGTESVLTSKHLSVPIYSKQLYTFTYSYVPDCACYVYMHVKVRVTGLQYTIRSSSWGETSSFPKPKLGSETETNARDQTTTTTKTCWSHHECSTMSCIFFFFSGFSKYVYWSSIWLVLYTVSEYAWRLTCFVWKQHQRPCRELSWKSSSLDYILVSVIIKLF